MRGLLLLTGRKRLVRRQCCLQRGQVSERLISRIFARSVSRRFCRFCQQFVDHFSRRFGQRHSHFGQNRHARSADFGKATGHDIGRSPLRARCAQDAGAQTDQNGRVPLHRGQIALGSGDLNLDSGHRRQAAFRADEVELQGPCHHAPLGRSRSETLSLGLHVFDAANHVEGRFRQMVIFAVHNCFERGDRHIQRNLNAVRPGEHFCHVEGL